MGAYTGVDTAASAGDIGFADMPVPKGADRAVGTDRPALEAAAYIAAEPEKRGAAEAFALPELAVVGKALAGVLPAAESAAWESPFEAPV